MTPFDWSPFLVDGGTRPDAMTGMNPDFTGALQQMIMAAPENVRSGFQINSAYRSPEVQAQLYQDAIAKYGSEAAARHKVAPPGHSRHNYGLAADLRMSPEAQAWVHANAGQYGLNFPMSWEPWHVEFGQRGEGANVLPTMRMGGGNLGFGAGVPAMRRPGVGQTPLGFPTAPAQPYGGGYMTRDQMQNLPFNEKMGLLGEMMTEQGQGGQMPGVAPHDFSSRITSSGSNPMEQYLALMASYQGGQKGGGNVR